MTALRVAVVDVGAVDNLGWASFDVETTANGSWSLRRISSLAHDYGTGAPADRGTSLERLISCVADALDRDVPVALGFECPVFVPVRRDTSKLLRRRCGENGSPYAAGAGALAYVAGLVESAYVLSRLQSWGRSATVDPAQWPDRHPLLLWEAFVSRAGKVGEDSTATPPDWVEPDDSVHVHDAATAAAAFVRKGVPSLVDSDIDTCGEPAFNTLAAAAVRAGLTSDTTELARRCYVVKAR